LLSVVSKTLDLQREEREIAVEWEMIAFVLLVVRDSDPDAIAKPILQRVGFHEQFLDLLNHAEPRIRQLCISFLPVFRSVSSASALFDTLGNPLLARIKTTFVRSAELQTSVLGGTESSVPLDDTTGWSTLETSLLAYHELVRCCGRDALMLVVSGSSDTCDLLITSASAHQNRFVREATISFIQSCCCMIASSAAQVLDASCVFTASQKQEASPAMGQAYRGAMTKDWKLSWQIADALVLGLGDNWSRIRQASCAATQAFISGLATDSDRDPFWGMLLPNICLNRFYAAEGVKSTALETWAGLVGTAGRDFVAKYVGSFIYVYADSSKSNNHMVSEAACSAMAEIVCRIEKFAVRPHLAPLVQALDACLTDDSWPVRDSSCIAVGSLLKHYGSEAIEITPSLLDNFFAVCNRHLKDSIWSLRENAAVALGDAIQCESSTVSSQTTGIISAYLDETLGDRARAGPKKTTFLSEAQIAALTTSSQAGPEAATPKKPLWRRGGGWGCCLDCMETREGDGADVSSGAVFLLREFARCRPELAARHFGQIFVLFDEKQSASKTKQDRMMVSAAQQIPEIVELLKTQEGVLETWNSKKDKVDQAFFHGEGRMP